VHLQEYAPPDTIDPEKARARLRDAVARTVEVLEVPRANVHVKTRRRQRGKAQYERVSEVGVELQIREGDARYWVNLTDYLDTGLFLDHRATRKMVAELARGGRLLNLYCYTASITVQAALAGARASTSVDLSNTYLDWAKRNFELNDLDLERHRLVQSDCTRWVRQQRPGDYDVVFLDPPTFSTSKRMEGTLDVQRDHVALIHDAMRMVADGGVLVFSTNRQKFRLAIDELSDLDVRDVTRDTVPPDYARTPNVHRCWQLRRR
jgi:23S rRNA (guanine2445-N2)-methyltransferase / 23S rRNA (guanine2069-N7)-methyltransferase